MVVSLDDGAAGDRDWAAIRQRIRWDDMKPRPRFFHGGVRGLAVGDYIVPALEINAASVSGDLGARYRRDRVYVTTSEAAAREYAGLTIPPALIEARRRGLPPADVLGLGLGLGGAVYEVEPVGPLEPDADEADHSWECQRARIARVVDSTVPPNLGK
jgi:hypothetical protein